MSAQSGQEEDPYMKPLMCRLGVRFIDLYWDVAEMGSYRCQLRLLPVLIRYMEEILLPRLEASIQERLIRAGIQLSLKKEDSNWT